MPSPAKQHVNFQNIYFFPLFLLRSFDPLDANQATMSGSLPRGTLRSVQCHDRVGTVVDTTVVVRMRYMLCVCVCTG